MKSCPFFFEKECALIAFWGENKGEGKEKKKRTSLALRSLTQYYIFSFISLLIPVFLSCQTCLASSSKTTPIILSAFSSYTACSRQSGIIICLFSWSCRSLCWCLYYGEEINDSPIFQRGKMRKTPLNTTLQIYSKLSFSVSSSLILFYTAFLKNNIALVKAASHNKLSFFLFLIFCDDALYTYSCKD